MAQRLVTTFADDLDGTEFAEGDGATVLFSYKGVTYVIDLKAGNATQFDQDMAKYVEHARPVAPERTPRRRGQRGSSDTDQVDMRDVRTWAQEQGIEIKDRGRVPQEVVAKYKAARK